MATEIIFSSDIIPPSSQRNIDSSIESFKETPFKFALQKDGELTQISLATLQKLTSISLADLLPRDGRKLFSVIDDHTGVAFVRNKAICQLVAHGSVDAGIVGLDQLYESGLREEVIVITEFREKGEWDIVLATPKEKTFSQLSEIQIVATQYPVIAQAFFKSIHLSPFFIPTCGSTEMMPLLTYDGQNIDAIVDLSVSGNTLFANGMHAWSPAIAKVYPVLIANKAAISDPLKMKYLQRFI